MTSVVLEARKNAYDALRLAAADDEPSAPPQQLILSPAWAVACIKGPKGGMLEGRKRGRTPFPDVAFPDDQATIRQDDQAARRPDDQTTIRSGD